MLRFIGSAVLTAFAISAHASPPTMLGVEAQRLLTRELTAKLTPVMKKGGVVIGKQTPKVENVILVGSPDPRDPNVHNYQFYAVVSFSEKVVFVNRKSTSSLACELGGCVPIMAPNFLALVGSLRYTRRDEKSPWVLAGGFYDSSKTKALVRSAR